MNKKLNDAIASIGKADAIMYAVEKCYLDFDFISEEMDRAERGTQMFYLLWDEIHRLSEILDLLAGDERVVDVLNKVNQAK